MDNREHRESTSELSAWVRASSDLLAPPADWDPNPGRARARFEARVEDRMRRQSGLKRIALIGAVAVLIACIVIPSIPQTSAFAQQIGSSSWHKLEQYWYYFTVVRSGPKMMGRLADAVNALHTPNVITADGVHVVLNAAEAASRAGFIPRLPNSNALPGSPRLSVAGPVSIVAVIRTADLSQALRSAAINDQPVPQQWDGARLKVEAGPTVTARWSDVPAWSDLTLVQGPARVTAPPGFDLEAFGAVVLRAAGMRNPEMVARLARHGTTVPSLLFGYRTPYRFVGAREVSVRTGPAAMIEEFGLASVKGATGYIDGVPVSDEIPRVERLTLLWSVPDRMYVLSGVPKSPPMMFALDLAAAFASAIDLANTIQ